MSDWFIPIVVLAWIAIGVGLLLVMGRRGHDGWSWFLLGALLGPCAVLFAVDAWRNDERQEPRPLSHAPADPEGAIDVLVGVDGSPEATAAIDGVVSLFGDRLRRLTLATVVTYDDGTGPERATVDRLREAASHLAWLAPELVVLYGHPATALAVHARNEGFHVLAVGAQRQHRSHLFGRTARELVGSSPVPVLVGGAPVATASVSQAAQS